MDPENDVVRMISELTQNTNRVLTSYAKELKRLNANLVACHKAMETQAREIVDTRDALNMHEQAIAKLLAKVFPDEAAQVMKQIPSN